MDFKKRRIKQCPMCRNEVKGRSDKRFCSVNCKSNYHKCLSAVTKSATSTIDKILHRNRSILLEVMGKNKKQIRIPILTLEKKKFQFNYVTKYTINSKGKIYNYVYDFAWMSFSNNEVIIYRR